MCQVYYELVKENGAALAGIRLFYKMTLSAATHKIMLSTHAARQM